MRDQWKKERYLAYGGPDVSWPSVTAHVISKTLVGEGHRVLLKEVCSADYRGIGPDGSVESECVTLYRVWVRWKKGE